MLSLRANVWASGLIAAIAVTSGNVFLAAQPKHEICAAQQHECGRTATLKECCCGDQGIGSTPRGLVESRIQLTPDLSSAPVPSMFAHVDDLFSQARVRIQTSPPRVRPLDLPTLFTSLLI